MTALVSRRVWLAAGAGVAGVVGLASVAAAINDPPPPATFYGTAQGAVPGGSVVAFVTKSGTTTICGDGVTAVDQGHAVYVIDVVASQQRAGCGVNGDAVQFYFLPAGAIGGRFANETGIWGPGPRERNVTLPASGLAVKSRAPQLARDAAAPVQPTPTTPAATSTASPTPTSTALICSASAQVNNSSPVKNSNITLTAVLSCTSGSPGGATMTSLWHFKTTTTGCDGTAAPNGVVSCTRSIGNATSGFTVTIDVTMAKDGQTWTATTEFTPQ